VRPVGLAWRIVLGEARQEAGIASQLGGDPVVGVPSHGERQDDDAGREMPDLRDHESPRCLVVLKVRVSQPGIPPFRHTQNLRGPVGFGGPQVRAAPRPRFTRGEIQYPGSIPRVLRLQQRAGTGELDVVSVSGDGEEVDGHDTDREREEEE
jgi:hypothetical protein